MTDKQLALLLAVASVRTGALQLLPLIAAVKEEAARAPHLVFLTPDQWSDEDDGA